MPIETTNTAPNSPQSDLEHCAEQFAQWRAERAHRREAVPETLRKQTVALLAHHRQTHILKALGINSNMLRRWRDESLEETLPPSSGFIELTGDEPVRAAASALSLNLDYGDGRVCRIEADFSLSQLTAFARGLSPFVRESV